MYSPNFWKYIKDTHISFTIHLMHFDDDSWLLMLRSRRNKNYQAVFFVILIYWHAIWSIWWRCYRAAIRTPLLLRRTISFLDYYGNAQYISSIYHLLPRKSQLTCKLGRLQVLLQDISQANDGTILAPFVTFTFYYFTIFSRLGILGRSTHNIILTSLSFRTSRAISGLPRHCETAYYYSIPGIATSEWAFEWKIIFLEWQGRLLKSIIN